VYEEVIEEHWVRKDQEARSVIRRPQSAS
jgi:hypothetical protein